MAEAKAGGAAQSPLTAKAPAPVLEEESDGEGASGSGGGMVEVVDVKTTSGVNITARVQANCVVVATGGCWWGLVSGRRRREPASPLRCSMPAHEDEPATLIRPLCAHQKSTTRRGLRLGFQCSRKRLELKPGLIELPKQRWGARSLAILHTTHNLRFQTRLVTRATAACQ